jgi:preprotein translocase subunit SecB
MTDPSRPPGIAISQVFLEEASFSHRADALALPLDTKPELGNIEIAVEAGLRPDRKAGLLRLSAATRPEAQPLYNVRVQMVGFFEQQSGSENLPMADFLGDSAPALLFPFLREAFANITSRGRFGPVWLNPINTRTFSEAFKKNLATLDAGR